MSREADFKARMVADTVLMGILLGGVFTYDQIDIEGLIREKTPTAFDTYGHLKPCCILHQRPLVPDGRIADGLAQIASVGQTVEVYIYQESLYTAIDAAVARLYILFHGVALPNAFPCELVNIMDRLRDTGNLAVYSLAKMDFLVRSILKPA